ncbi:hypothetical protein L9F63_015832, partial [Diploptera punctata]
LRNPFWKKPAEKNCQYVWKICLRQQDTCFQCRMLHITTIKHKKRKTHDEKNASNVLNFSPKTKPKERVVDVWKNMTVTDLANTMDRDVDHVFEVMTFVNDSVYYNKPSSVIDNFVVIQDVVKKSGMKCRTVPRPDVKEPETINKDATKRPPPDPSVLVKRPSVVTVMGHVDHGKTTLLDSLRNTSVVETEFGGITQHIGAFSVKLQSKDTITFLDTPGHAAFTAMRARAEVPIIVAINKIDKAEADIERTKDMLIQHGIQVEDRGGEVQAIPISALQKTNLDILSEAIALQAELMDLKGDPRGLVEGTVVESKTDPHRGKLSTAIVQRGTLRKGAVLVAGLAWAKVRVMFNEKGQLVQEAPPATPVEVLGWRELPSAGDEIIQVESERRANEVMRWRQSLQQTEKQEVDREAVEAKLQVHLKVYKPQLEERRRLGKYKMRRTGPREKEIKDDDQGPRVSIVVRRDVDGSVEAILDVLETYDDNEKCKLDLVHYGIGAVTETDVELADAFNAIVYSFNVETPDRVKKLAKENNISIRPHNIIYKLIDDLKKEISASLPLIDVEEIL